jgi:hypothetical protein
VRQHEALVKEVEAADAGEGFDVLFFGDSILESTRCTLLCSCFSL